MHRLSLLAVCLTAVACNPPPGEEHGGLDASFTHEGNDAGFDAGSPDAALADAGSPDSGLLDGGPPDAGPFDGGTFDAGLPDAGHLDAGPPDAGVARKVTVCLTGAVDQSSGSNADFGALCDRLGPLGGGLVRSGTHSSWATFPNANADAVKPAVMSALDANHDGMVNAADGPVVLNLIGFSWGGINAGHLATSLAGDSRITQSAVFMRLIILDAYQPLVSTVLAPTAADEAFSFRHTVASSGDCSKSAPLGPYLGARLRCPTSQRCFDYNFSAAPGSVFNGIAGSQVGHCDVPRAAEPYIVQLVTSGTIHSALPPSVPVTP